MSRYWRYAVGISSLALLVGCPGKKTHHLEPLDPFAAIPVGALSLTSLSGANVLLLTIGGLVTGDTAHPLPELDARHTALLEAANAALDTAVRRDGREVIWMGLDEQRRAARRNPTLDLDPDRMATVELFDAKVERIPDPLFGRVRQLAALMGARYAVAPAGVKIGGTTGALVASYVVVVADARAGNVIFRARATGGAAATPEAALASAARLIIASPLH